MNSLTKIDSVGVLDVEGHRAFVKYYLRGASATTVEQLGSFEKQRAFEKTILASARDAQRSQGSLDATDVLVIDGSTVVYQFGGDVLFFVSGNTNQNELVLSSVLSTLVETLRRSLESHDLNLRLLLENYDALLLSVDELLDNGIILEMNPLFIEEQIRPYITDTGADTTMQTLNSLNRYVRENL